MENKVTLLVSYFPLMNNQNFTLDTKVSEVRGLIEKTTEECPGYGDACIWLGNPATGGVEVIFVFERAQEIAKHLIEWSENEPENWFALEHGSWEEKDSGEEHYFMRLAPSLQKSIDRVVAMKTLNGEIRHSSQIPKDPMVMFSYLGYEGKGESYRKCEGMFQDRIRVSLSPKQDFTGMDYEELQKKIFPLGEFPMKKTLPREREFE